MEQYYIDARNYEKEIIFLLKHLGIRNIFLVCGKSYDHLPLNGFIRRLQMNQGITLVCFDGFSPNPVYEDIVEGVKNFHAAKCDCIFAVGGGSAIDAAKCIKLFAGLKTDRNYLEQEFCASAIPLFAVPTTAGTGSESTQFAVIYVNGEKYSIEHESILPQYVFLYPSNLKTLPDYQRKSAVCDALAHAIESFWSIKSSVESKKLSVNALGLLMENMEAYLQNEEASYANMLLASNLAGKAINITKTTAAHAMCYRLAKCMEIPHGHAVMLCLPEVWEYMQGNLAACVDRRGKGYLEDTLLQLADCLKQETPEDAIVFLKKLRCKLGLDLHQNLEEPIDDLVNSVNKERLKNFPVDMGKEEIYQIYKNILSQ